MNRRMHWPIVVLTLLVAVSGCQRDTPEAALRSKLQEMQEAAGAKKVGDFMEGVTVDFAGNEGIDRAALHNMMRAQTLGRANIGVTTGPVQIDLQDERATVRFTAVLTGGNGRFVPDSAQVYAITSGWRLEDGEWRVYYAKWEPDP